LIPVLSVAQPAPRFRPPLPKPSRSSYGWRRPTAPAYTLSAGLDRYLIIPVEKAMVDKAQVFLAEQLTFGLQDGELVSVETLALESE
jgi:hypothetical protein